MRHAWPLKRLLIVSAEDLRGLNAEARAKWLSLIRAHAMTLNKRPDLAPGTKQVFSPSLSPAEVPIVGEISDDASMARAVERRLRPALAMTEQSIRVRDFNAGLGSVAV